MKKLTLELTLEQAEALTRQLDLAFRMHLAQFGEIAMLARMGVLKKRTGEALSLDEINALEKTMEDAKRIFGFDAGSSFGIGSQAVSDEAKRGYEIMKVVQKSIAYERNATNNWSVQYDGLIVRYTNDPAPVAYISRGE